MVGDEHRSTLSDQAPVDELRFRHPPTGLVQMEVWGHGLLCHGLEQGFSHRWGTHPMTSHLSLAGDAFGEIGVEKVIARARRYHPYDYESLPGDTRIMTEQEGTGGLRN